MPHPADELFAWDEALPSAPPAPPSAAGGGGDRPERTPAAEALRQAARAEIVEVRLLTGLDRALSYRVPPLLRDTVVAGSLVRVPLGQRAELGLVLGPAPAGGPPRGRLKELLQALYPFPVLPPDLLAVAHWMADYYACPLAEVFEKMIPGPVRQGMSFKSRALVRVLKAPTEAELATLKKKAPKQAELLAFLAEQRVPVPKTKVLDGLGISPTALTGLIEKGWVEETRERQERHAYDDDLAAGEMKAAQASSAGIALNDDQQAALRELLAGLGQRQFRPFLLHGVTGSGKTEVYLGALQAVLREGGGAIFLVPEVALTPQTVGRLRSRLEAVAKGHRVVVWHSSLSEGERLDAWHALATGEARLVVGARSAIFAPVRDLRLIVVDEEHEPAYKQEEMPRYHGRDTAVYRAHVAGAVCVLGSATPSLESLHNARSGKYGLLRLPQRVDDRRLPVVYVVDMGKEMRGKGHIGLLSRPLADRLRDRWEKREQSILFLNRRGFHSSVMCPQCQDALQCPHCTVTLTHHKTDELLKCHLCGYTEPVPEKCPRCGTVAIQWRGHGTQRVEEATRKLLPQAKIVRLDTDTMSQKNLFRQHLADFRAGKIDIIVGTQMIAKGLDFPNVTLVGMVDADISLNMSDFRAAERTFQLLVQVAGRAGRGDRAGEVIIQTFLPHSSTIQYARQQDFAGFAEEELEKRREAHYPPFRHIVQHLFRSHSLDKVTYYTEQWARFLEKEPLPEVELRGPAPCHLEKVADEYRFQMWYLMPSITRCLPALRDRRAAFPMDPEVTDTLDVDPVSTV